MEDWQLIAATIFGGGGIVASIAKLYDLKKARDNDELAKEDTEISRWRAHVERAEASSAKAWRLVSWYRQHYFLVRDRLPREDRKDFPPGPPADMES